MTEWIDSANQLAAIGLLGLKKKDLTFLQEKFNELRLNKDRYINSNDFKLDTRDNRDLIIDINNLWIAQVAMLITETEEYRINDPNFIKLFEKVEDYKNEIEVVRTLRQWEIIGENNKVDLMELLRNVKLKDNIIPFFEIMHKDIYPMIDQYVLVLNNIGDRKREQTEVDKVAKTVIRERLKKIGDALSQVIKEDSTCLTNLFRSYDEVLINTIKAEISRRNAELEMENETNLKKLEFLEEQVEELRKEKEMSVVLLDDIYRKLYSKLENVYLESKEEYKNRIDEIIRDKEEDISNYKVRVIKIKRKYDEKIKDIKNMYDNDFKNLESEKKKLEDWLSSLQISIKKVKQDERALVQNEINNLTCTIGDMEERIRWYHNNLRKVQIEKEEIEDNLSKVEKILSGKKKGCVIPKIISAAMEFKIISVFNTWMSDLIGSAHVIYDPINKVKIKMTSNNCTIIRYTSSNQFNKKKKLPKNDMIIYYFEDSILNIFKKGRIGIGIRYLSNNKSLDKIGLEREKFGVSELFEQVKKIEKIAKRNGTHIIIGLFSSTGWTSEAVNYLLGNDPNNSFKNNFVTLVLIDLCPKHHGNAYYAENGVIDVDYFKPCYKLDEYKKEIKETIKALIPIIKDYFIDNDVKDVLIEDIIKSYPSSAHEVCMAFLELSVEEDENYKYNESEGKLIFTGRKVV